MRLFSTFALLVIMFLGSGFTGATIAVVDPSKLYQESASGKAGLAHLQQMETDIQEQFTKAQTLLEKMNEDEGIRLALQETFGQYQQIVTEQQQKMMDVINTQIEEAIQLVRKEKKYTAVISTEGLLAFDEQADITKDVIAVMDKKPVTFEKVTIPALEAPKPAEKETEKK